MPQEQIVNVGNSAAVLLSRDALDQMGVQVGDLVDVSVIDRKLIVQPLEGAERQQRVNAAVADILGRRKSAYQKLAEGQE